MKGRHLAAIAIALVVVSSILFFGTTGKREQAVRGVAEDGAAIPPTVEAASTLGGIAAA